MAVFITDSPFKNGRVHAIFVLAIRPITRDFYDFKKIDEELPADEEFENAAEALNNNEYAKTFTYYGNHTCKMFTDAPKWVWEQIKLNYAEVTSDLDRKLEISDSLAKYTSESNNSIMSYIQVLLAIATFFFLLFPSKAEAVAKWIKELWNALKLW